MKLNKLETDVLEFVKTRTNDNPISLSELSEMCHTDRRLIKKAIHNLREHYPICSNVEQPNGYYIGDVFDIHRNINRIEKVVTTLERTQSNLRKSFMRLKPIVRINIPPQIYLNDSLLAGMVGVEIDRVKQLQGKRVDATPSRFMRRTDAGILWFTNVWDTHIGFVGVPESFIEWVGYSDEF